MKTFKRMVFFYFINIIIWFSYHLILSGDFLSILKNPATWIFAIIPVLIAQFISFLIYQGGREIHSPLKNTITYLVCALILHGIVFNDRHSMWKWQRDNGNIESNRMYFDTWHPLENIDKTKIAFDTLIQKFQTPNDIELTTHEIDPQKIFENDRHLPDTLFEVEFRYKKQGTEYKAALLVYQSQAQLLYYDQPLTRKDKIEIDFRKRKQRYELKGVLKQLPDSVRNEVEEAFKEF